MKTVQSLKKTPVQKRREKHSAKGRIAREIRDDLHTFLYGDFQDGSSEEELDNDKKDLECYLRDEQTVQGMLVSYQHARSIYPDTHKIESASEIHPNIQKDVGYKHTF